ncbi:MAG TPA: nickel pincer cofactor biosynthesis protein LarC [Candidatus Sulfotelmatobacter sp.]|nr:nickel pincer cofactor biosynthesis protein LarC [Candidatus Sulfotelmatobacter sp.]
MTASTRVAYVEMIGGAAGDMLLAAFLDAGLDATALETALRGVVADGWSFTPERVVKRGIAATYARLVVPGEDGAPDHDHHHHRGPRRTLADVLAIVERSGLTPRQRERASRVYRRLAEAEARVHGVDVDRIHFHEIGQIDAILDVAAFCVALDLLEIDEVRCSAFPIGHGTIRMEHGTYPNPPPATAELLRGWPTHAVDVAGELVTTTAAAILTTLAAPGGRPDVVVERIGYGAGTSDFSVPNVTRVSIGTLTAAAAPPDAERDEIVVLEANVDDLAPQHFELALERIFAAGARDAWLTPIVMKKGRPAILLSAIADPSAEDAVARAILRETTTIGVRVRTQRRYVLPRRIVTIETAYGPVRVKEVSLDGTVRAQPEHDDLVRIARERGVPLPEVARTVARAIDAGARV